MHAYGRILYNRMVTDFLFGGSVSGAVGGAAVQQTALETDSPRGLQRPKLGRRVVHREFLSA